MAFSAHPQALVFLNGKVVSYKDAKVSIFDRGFLFGDGVYETGVAYHRCPVFLEEHWTRLRKSADRIYIPVPWSDNELTTTLFDTARLFAKNEIYFRTIITRGIIDRIGLEVAAEQGPTLAHIVQPLPLDAVKRYRTDGLSLITSGVVRNSARAQDPNIKTSNYLNSLLALQDAKAKGAQDAVMCNHEGFVTEGTTFSIFAVQGKRLLTPALNAGILDSITRRHILKLAGTDFEIEEGLFGLSQFQKSDEVFIASSVREIVPVRQWDGLSYRIPGAATQILASRLREVIETYTDTHAKF